MPSTPTLILAPLRGVTGYIFRSAFAEHFGGFDLAVGPFIPAVRGTTIKPSHLRDALPENNVSMPLIPQTIGNDPATLLTMAQTMAERGYTEINWNLGCPFGKITRKRRGSGLLPYPETVRSILEELYKRLTIGLSVKLRLGLESAEDLQDIIPVLNDFPLKSITIHARTAAQMYEGVPDLVVFGKYLPRFCAPVIYNGNIRTREDWERFNKEFDTVKAVMIGRGAVADPFLPGELKGIPRPEEQEIRRRLRQFHDELFERYGAILPGPAAHLGAMKELWTYLIEPFSNNRRPLKKIQRTTSPKRYCEYVDRLFCGEHEWEGLSEGLPTAPVTKQ